MEGLPLITVKNTFIHVEEDEHSSSDDGEAGSPAAGRPASRRRAYSDSEAGSQSASSVSESWTTSGESGRAKKKGTDSPDGYPEFLNFAPGVAALVSSALVPKPNEAGSQCEASTYSDPERRPPGPSAMVDGNPVQREEETAQGSMSTETDILKKTRPSRAKRAQAKRLIEELQKAGYGGRGLQDVRQAVEQVEGQPSNKEAFIMKKLILSSTSESGQDQEDASRPSQASSWSASPPLTISSTALRTDAARFVPGAACSKLSL